MLMTAVTYSRGSASQVMTAEARHVSTCGRQAMTTGYKSECLEREDEVVGAGPGDRELHSVIKVPI